MRRLLPSWKQLTLLALFCCASLGGAFAYLYLTIPIPDAHDTARRQATVYYWADGSRMVSVGDVNRQDIALARVPGPVQTAVIAAENAGFYTDPGISVMGVARAAVNIFKGQEIQGGSTITQQYVKNTYLTQEQTAGRKIKELVLSLKVNGRLSKAEILEGYLNTSWFGRDSYGIQAAAEAYYGIPAEKLTPSQGALLAALLKGAETLDPSLSAANHRRAVERWKWILDREVETGLMTAAERAKYTVFPEPRKPVKPTSQAGQTGYLVDIANKYLKSRGGPTEKDLAGGGYRIHTTFEKDKVRALAASVEKVRAESLDPKKREADRHVQVGAASVRAEDGAVVAVYGGADAITHFSNNADTAGVPAGSAFKPFVLASALESGSGTRALGGSEPSLGGSGQSLGVSTAGLSDALVTQRHGSFVTAGKAIGLRTVRDTAVATGLRKESMAELEPTFALGTSTPSAVRLASAYTTFVNRGERREPYSVTRVELGDETLEGFERPAARRALTAGTALEVGRTLAQLGWESREKESFARYPGEVQVGRTSEQDRMKSAWFIGATPELSTAVTMFRAKPDEPQLLPMSGVGGEDSARGTVFPPRIWFDYQSTVAPYAPTAPGWDEKSPGGNGMFVPPAGTAPVA
ncbi:transglycosylase domain-containing protein [Streptomyces paludis]|uniref:Penicillin-binding protein n=1 Tax=Streptomyces paludis TaxID=2282738 RepID=A0A345HTZ5_9ACTN|nr:transglycosylase domain-containing protein [Streptomyces paludis]AXG80169.1 penicillin-binding protein [Streptomyces paludis]